MFGLTKSNKVYLILIFLSFSLINCYDGCNCTGCGSCTSHKTVDTEKQKREVDGIKIKIEVEKVKHKNRKLSGLFNPYKEVRVDRTTWFTAVYNVQIQKRPMLSNVMEIDCDNEEDFSTYPDKLEIKFSPEKTSFAVGYMKKAASFYHLLSEGSPFPSHGFYWRKIESDTTSSPDIDKIDWSVFPKTNALFDSIIVNSIKYGCTVESENIYLALLAQMEPGNSHELALINNWYNRIAMMFFDEQRVKKIISASPEWKKIAVEKSINILKKGHDDVFDFDNHERVVKTLNLVTYIDDKECLLESDNFVFSKRSEKIDSKEYLLHRIANKINTLSTENKKNLVDSAKIISSKFPDFTFGGSYDFAIEVLLAYKETKALNDFVTKAITADSYSNFNSGVGNLTMEKYDKYPPEVQKEIVKRYTVLAHAAPPEINQYDYSDILKFLKGKIPKEESKAIFDKNKDKLGIND